MATILVVDDDPALLRAVHIPLTARGHEVVTARPGEAGMPQSPLP